MSTPKNARGENMRGKSIKMPMSLLHRSEKRACHGRWTGEDGLVHLCRAHTTETGECLCPCGMSREAVA